MPDMQLVEIDGKKLLKNIGIAIPESYPPPYEGGARGGYLKAQVLSGSRGKRRLVRQLTADDNLEAVETEMRAILGDEPCAGFLLEAATPVKEEWLVSLDLDRATGEIRCHVSAQGGKDVSDVSTYALRAEKDCDAIKSSVCVNEIIKTLFKNIATLDAISIEINPLGIRADESGVALDAKIELDALAAFRHPEWSDFTELSRFGRVRSERETAFLTLRKNAITSPLGRYVELDGNIAMVLAGGGASLVAMDALVAAGGKPANYVEMSGNPDPDYVRQAARIALSRHGLKGVWIAGSFANFTDIQTTVMAVLSAYEDVGLRVPVVVRRDGPHAGQAEQDVRSWAERVGVLVLFHRGNVSLDESARELMSVIPSGAEGSLRRDPSVPRGLVSRDDNVQL